MNKQHQWNSWYFFVTLPAILLFQNWWATTRNVEVVPCSEFLSLLNDGRIVELTVEQEQISGRFKDPINSKPYFVINRVDPALTEQISGCARSTTPRRLPAKWTWQSVG